MSRTNHEAYRKRKISRSRSDNEERDTEEGRDSSEKVRKITSKHSQDRRSSSSSCSEDESSNEKCPVCLKKIKNQTLAITDSCRHHTFCLSCLVEWSKTRKTCPVDRKEYTSILELDVRGKVTKQIPINPVVASTIVVSWSPPYDTDATFCEICGLMNSEDGMLVCDGCGMGFHLYCLMPPMDTLPNGIWLCNDCWDYYN